MILLERLNLNCHILSHWATFMYVAFYFVLYFIFIFCNPAVRLQNTINQCDDDELLAVGACKLSRWQRVTRVEAFEFRDTATIVIRCQGLVVGPVLDWTDQCFRSIRHHRRDDHPRDHDGSSHSQIYL